MEVSKVGTKPIAKLSSDVEEVVDDREQNSQMTFFDLAFKRKLYSEPNVSIDTEVTL